MKTTRVVFDCDTRGCLAHLQAPAADADQALHKYGWTERDGRHHCAQHSRVTCCRCNPVLCEADDTGDHCTTSACGYCLHGCPAPDNTPCCQTPNTTRQEGTT